MISSLLVSLAIALQGAPSKPATKPLPITAVPADEGGPSVEVSAPLARLAGPDTIAVLYMPSAARADEAIERLRATAGPLANEAPLPIAPMKRLLKEAIRTELEIPLDQPVIWWIEKPQVADDEPGMGMGNFTMHQALRIPGATAANEKARADANGKDGKGRPALPVRSARRGASVTVLPDDLVVTSSDMEPFAPPADGAQPSVLARTMPQGVVSGRVDLGRLLEEEGDQLKMLAGFATMAMNDQQGDEATMTAEEKRRAEMRRTFSEGVGTQIGNAIDALLQLKRASFALQLEGDELDLWTDWSRDAAFPAGLSEGKARELAQRLPAGLPVYAGMSANALDTIYGERVSIDDAIATLGATPEARQAWTDACARTRAAIAMIEEGAVMAADASGNDPTVMIAFRVKEAAAFRTAIRDIAASYGRSGLASTKVEEAGDTLRVELTPSAERMRDIIGAFAGDATIDAESLQRALQPMTLALAFQGNDVMLTQARTGQPAPQAGAGDLRPAIARRAWGGADWFVTIDLRHALGRAAAEAATNAGAEVDALRKGKPAGLHLWQGVKGNTTRLSVHANLAELRALAADLDALERKLKAAGKAKGDEDDDDDDDEDEGKEAGAAAKQKSKSRRERPDDDT